MLSVRWLYSKAHPSSFLGKLNIQLYLWYILGEKKYIKAFVFNDTEIAITF